MFHAGYDSGYVTYSPRMELEADQFAMYVLNNGNRRLDAGTDRIIPNRPTTHVSQRSSASCAVVVQG